MSFYTEPAHNEKTAISDLQGAWICLRNEVVQNFGFPGSERLIFHIDEAMSWECVRDLGLMRPLIILIDNIVKQSGAPAEIGQCVEGVRETYADTLMAIKEGEAR